MKFGRRIILGILILAAFACVDRDAELREEFRASSLSLADRRLPGSERIVLGFDGWLLTWGELQYLKAGSYIGDAALQSNRRVPPEYADPLPAIVDFHRQLQERGIELYVVPVPVRPVIYPESVLGPEPFANRETIPNLDLAMQELCSALRESGVRVVDITSAFLSRRNHPKRGPVFCPSDTHWTPYGITVAAQILAAEIKQRPWFEAVPKQKYRQRWTTKMHNGHLYRDYEIASGTALEPDPVRMRRITFESKDGRERLGLDHPQSPVIVIGDSNTLQWSRSRSGLPHSLAFELGFPADVLSIPGGGANQSRLNLIRKIRAEPEYLEGKHVVIWCFSARYFTNSTEGWIPMPL